MAGDYFISLLTNVGFPVTLCFVLIKYVLQTIGEKLDKLDSSLHELTKAINESKQITKNAK